MPNLHFTIDNNNLSITDSFDLPQYTILVWKNNSGKSHLLRSLAIKIESKITPRTWNNDQYGYQKLKARYVTPERWWYFQREATLEDKNAKEKYSQDRSKVVNQSSDFIQDAVSAFNGLFNRIRRPWTRLGNNLDNELIDYLNNKITGVVFRLSTQDDHAWWYNFIINDSTTKPIPDHLSSWTIQIISLMMYVLDFVYSWQYEEDAVLLIDEPDVHIHPDLQIEFINFLISVTKDTSHKVIIATHSSSIIAWFENQENTFLATRKANELKFIPINNELKSILPALWTHSLSYVFNKAPLLLLEWEDDIMVWQYAIRKSWWKIRFHLVEVAWLGGFGLYESLVNEISTQLFDRPLVYEIRDRDVDSSWNLHTQELNDIWVIKRCKLYCRKIENLILSNEVLNQLGVESWEVAQSKLQWSDFEWIDRYAWNIEYKEYRIIPLLKTDNSKSREVLVWNTIWENISRIDELKDVEGSIFHMLWDKICDWLLSTHNTRT